MTSTTEELRPSDAELREILAEEMNKTRAADQAPITAAMFDSPVYAPYINAMRRIASAQPGVQETEFAIAQLAYALQDSVERVARAIYDQELSQEGKPPIPDTSWKSMYGSSLRRFHEPRARAALQAAMPGKPDSNKQDDADDRVA